MNNPHNVYQTLLYQLEYNNDYKLFAAGLFYKLVVGSCSNVKIFTVKIIILDKLNFNCDNIFFDLLRKVNIYPDTFFDSLIKNNFSDLIINAKIRRFYDEPCSYCNELFYGCRPSINDTFICCECKIHFIQIITGIISFNIIPPYLLSMYGLLDYDLSMYSLNDSELSLWYRFHGKTIRVMIFDCYNFNKNFVKPHTYRSILNKRLLKYKTKYIGCHYCSINLPLHFIDINHHICDECCCVFSEAMWRELAYIVIVIKYHLDILPEIKLIIMSKLAIIVL